MSTQLNILLICNLPPEGNDANTITDHIESLLEYSSHKMFLCTKIGRLPADLDLNKFDVVIIHYSICLLNDYYLTKHSKRRLRNFNGLKVIFVQDEYRKINKMIRELQYLNIDVLYTCFPEVEIARIYPDSKLPQVAKINNLTGYVPERLLSLTLPVTKERKIDVGYRGRKLAYWFGELGYEKWSIVDGWLENTKNKALTVDLSYHEKDRIYGKNWIKFLTSCKTTLGVESGSSVMDFTGRLEKKVEFYQSWRPKVPFHKVQEKFLLEHEGKHRLNQISPRCFEAIALKTALVLYEGEYSNVLEPWRHYIPLKKDFSNIDKVVELIKDSNYLQNMVDTAYQEIALNPKHSYREFIKSLDFNIEREFALRNKQHVVDTYTPEQYAHDVSNESPFRRLYGKIYTRGQKIYKKLPLGARIIVRCCVRPFLILGKL